MADEITIRRATADDAAALGAVHVQTWREAYTGRMPQPVLDALTPARSTARWTQALASADGPAVTVVAIAGDRIVGFATAGPDRTDPDHGIELYSIYVLEAHHRRGVGQRLLDEAIGDHAAALWILDDNPRADDFYPRNGFVRTGAHRLDDRFPGGRLREIRMTREGTDPSSRARPDASKQRAAERANAPVAPPSSDARRTSRTRDRARPRTGPVSTDLTWTAVARASSGAATAASLPPERDQRHAASDAPQRAADAKPATAKTPSAGSAQPAAPRSKTAAKPADDAPVARSPKIPPKPGAPRRTAAWRPSPEFVERWLPFYEAAHADAELSGAEHATTERIEAALDDLGIEHVRVSDTGTVAVIRNGDGPVIAFRADIDGLPVTEATGLAYASARTAELDGRSVGTMHACGHDTHFTSALAAAQHFAANLDAWAGTLVIVFQPAEETAAGAAAMLAGGLWDRVPKPQIVLGQHVMPLPAGVVALRSGDLMSLADTLRVTVRGRQAHGSQPEASVDPVVAAASAVVRLQTVVARETAPGAGVVVTVGTFHAGTAANVIPATAEFTVNVRTPDERTRQATLDAVHRIVRAEADASRAEVEIEAVTSFPRCVNDDAHTARVTGLLVKAFGAKHVLSLDRPLTGSEDVGALADAIGVPLVYWFFGGFPEGAFADGATPPGNHSSHFAPDGRLALATGITGAVNVLRAYLQRRG